MFVNLLINGKSFTYPDFNMNGLRPLGNSTLCDLTRIKVFHDSFQKIKRLTCFLGYYY